VHGGGKKGRPQNGKTEREEKTLRERKMTPRAEIEGGEEKNRKRGLFHAREEEKHLEGGRGTSDQAKSNNNQGGRGTSSPRVGRRPTRSRQGTKTRSARKGHGGGQGKSGRQSTKNQTEELNKKPPSGRIRRSSNFGFRRVWGEKWSPNQWRGDPENRFSRD